MTRRRRPQSYSKRIRRGIKQHSSQLRKHSVLLKHLARSPIEVQRTLIRGADTGFIKTLSQIARNILLGNIQLNNRIHNIAKKHRTTLRNLAHSHNISHKRALIQKPQRGGIFPLFAALIPAILKGVAGAAAGAAAGALTRKIIR